ncbi:isochorismatase family protein [Lentzea sp. NBC_00516]|uniref:isochorismatase family protein n=1 Tax=Lentzea sp. NBC_00516 TaxID=2903582 RepID=UPI002E81D5EB|nr:isochorismatase family protein [Lentzea sp. NBC_00516]WUD28598.1 isochorismatase family protein [Lentzea sp. NBC_00516]
MTGIPAIASYALPRQDELPASVASWKIDPDRAVLLIHDMQRYFVRPFPADTARQLTDNVTTVLGRCRDEGVPIAYTAQPGSMSVADRGLLKDFWGPGMRVDPADREVVEPLTPRTDDWLLTKWRYSAFFRTDLQERMRAAGRDQLVICGIYAHIGVLMTAVEAFTNDIETFLVADAVADFSAERHRMALRYAASCCAVVLTTQEVLR